MNKEFEASLNISIPERMYAIVGIIDEFADLMMASSSDFKPIARIARSHALASTSLHQRPSREVITGLIKPTSPTRIAFKVASRVNSQIILDENGRRLLEMEICSYPLVLPTWCAQGAYISDEDMKPSQGLHYKSSPTHYLVPPLIAWHKKKSENEIKNSLYEQARQIVIDTKNASHYFLAKKTGKSVMPELQDLMDELEVRGVISSQEGSKDHGAFQSEEKDLDRSSAD
jgi:S-DNA-T family DNA segregation ATPase FtsK/SpoIIIE